MGVQLMRWCPEVLPKAALDAKKDRGSRLEMRDFEIRDEKKSHLLLVKSIHLGSGRRRRLRGARLCVI